MGSLNETGEFSSLQLELDAGVATLWLNRPASRNAVNLAMCKELTAACEALDADDDVRAVLVRGRGVAFCAGADLKERQGMTQAEMLARRVEAFTAYAAIEALSKPVIAVVHGAAFGSGCEIAAACDFALGSTSAAFKYPEVTWGTVGATQRLPRIVGRRMAKELLFTGRLVEAAEALSLGLLNRVFTSEGLDQAVLELAQQIAHSHPLTVRLTKHCIDAGLELTREGAMAIELLAIQRSFRHGDGQTAIASFGKRGKEPADE